MQGHVRALRACHDRARQEDPPTIILTEVGEAIGLMPASIAEGSTASAAMTSSGYRRKAGRLPQTS
eukprot:2218154-Pyramimonas_sp.AAC.1